jgi:exodeoxyribonuclease V gamma subunit
VRRSILGPVEDDSARELLGELVDLRAKGLCAPLLMAVKTSATYAERRASGMSPDNALALAGREWTGVRFDGERAEEAHRLAWGADAPLGVLLAGTACPDEQGPGWRADEPTRFGVLARRLWDPLLGAESLETV